MGILTQREDAVVGGVHVHAVVYVLFVTMVYVYWYLLLGMFSDGCLFLSFLPSFVFFVSLVFPNSVGCLVCWLVCAVFVCSTLGVAWPNPLTTFAVNVTES